MRVLPLLALLCFVHQTSGLYFYLQRGMVKCFKDELVKNSVSLRPYPNFLNHFSLLTLRYLP